MQTGHVGVTRGSRGQKSDWHASGSMQADVCNRCKHNGHAYCGWYALYTCQGCHLQGYGALMVCCSIPGGVERVLAVLRVARWQHVSGHLRLLFVQ
eukprot:1818264-Pyramimonas_sp.AAC.1